ncbi:hypothetical protein OG416_35390 (plasmid) [Streptomyces longwoodensis]|uniref:hypothetical protein n=1 Tax=Streptomyces longwoodensis TaxID=68231 RepID=UPI0030DE46ED|nr:hypothetical protein OG416_35390 [Streptomyces longwoodensis]
MPMGCGHGPDDGSFCGHEGDMYGGRDMTGYEPVAVKPMPFSVWASRPQNLVALLVGGGFAALVLYVLVGALGYF